jgi:uncharacterized protein (DUF1684 family)
MKWMWLLLCMAFGGELVDDYTQSIENWRQRRLENLRKEDGWLTLAGLYWLEPGENRFGSDSSNTFRFPKGPARLGSFHWTGGRLQLTSEVGVYLGGRKLHQILLDPQEKEAATVMKWGSLSWYTVRRDGRLGVRLKDSDSLTRLNFGELEYFPIAPNWRLAGRFEPYPEARVVKTPSVVEGLNEIARSPGELVFEQGGRNYRLQAQAEVGESGFFVVFGDRTNGSQSYGGGRFLAVDAPDSEGRVILDFNKAYNPPCIFTPYATCPLPTAQNRLPLEVCAGEKFAGHGREPFKQSLRGGVHSSLMINTGSKPLNLPGRNDWLAAGAPRRLDPESLACSDYVAISLENPGAEDALLAAGMALAQGHPTVLAAPDRKHLPWFLREADLSYPSQVLVVEGEQVAQQSHLEALHGQPIEAAKSYDTFIGCLMSGLSKEQYAEGRSHLLQVHETLGQKLDSPQNYCEGIAVGSTDTFGTPKESLVVDLAAVKGSEQCVFYQYDNSSRPSGMWVELGAALAWGKPCTLLTPDLNGVPPAVRQGMPQLKVVEYGSHEEMLKLLQDRPQELLNR